MKERTESFLRNAEMFVALGAYDLAAFNLELYRPLIVEYMLLVKTGTSP